MDTFRTCGPLGSEVWSDLIPARTCGPVGFSDQGDPNVTTWLGGTRGPLGFDDVGDPTLRALSMFNGICLLADHLPVSRGTDAKAAAATCPRPLAARAGGASLDVDWAFISEREGGQVLTGYVPAADVSASGVTIGTGIDLGARSEADIDKLDIGAALKTTLKPYTGKKKKDATDYLKDHPLTLTKDEAESLDKAVKKPIVDTLVSQYNAAVDAANKADGCTRVHFEALPQGVQTAVASTSFQYGSLAKATPTYWKQVTEQRWKDASDNLKKFGDAYPTRRKLEAGLVDAAISAAPAPVPATTTPPAPATPTAVPATPTVP